MAKLTGNNLKYVAERLVSLSKYGTQWLGVKCHTDKEAKEAASLISTVYGGTSVKDCNPAQQAGSWLSAGATAARFNTDNTFWVKFADGSTRLNTFNDIQAAVAKYLEENEVQTGSDETLITPDNTYEEPLVEENTGNESKGNTKTLIIIAAVALVAIVLAVVLFKKED